MKKVEKERLEKAIKEGLNSDYEKLRVICEFRGINFKKIIESFSQNIASFIFTFLYNKQNKPRDLCRKEIELHNWLVEKDDYIITNFHMAISIVPLMSAWDGLHISLLISGPRISLEYEIVKKIIDELKQEHKRRERVSREQRQQYKWAARQGRKK